MTLIRAGLHDSPSEVDVLVVGLGVTGAGCALDAVSRGLSVLAVNSGSDTVPTLATPTTSPSVRRVGRASSSTGASATSPGVSSAWPTRAPSSEGS